MPKPASLKNGFRLAEACVYHGHALEWRGDHLFLTYHFEIVGLAHFNHVVAFDLSAASNTPESAATAESWHQSQMRLCMRSIDALGLVELISYWKCACPARVHLESMDLSLEQQAWWRKLWYLGLGEFRYLNKIETTQDEFVHFLPNHEITPTPSETAQFANDPNTRASISWQSEHRFLIPIGGGKDSAVTLDLLKNEPRLGLLVTTNEHMNPPAEACARVAGIPLIRAHRQLDPRLMELNHKGYLNGHIPFSATLAFISLIAAALTSCRWIALSNESSASEPTVPESDVNHQYSKSLEFERNFQAYTEKWLTTDIQYFSLLRPLNEIQIAEKFARLKQYHPHAVSCNRSLAKRMEGAVCTRQTGGAEPSPALSLTQETTKQIISNDSGESFYLKERDVYPHGSGWCGHCPKCLSSYLLFAPFMEDHQLHAIFGRDLLNDATLWSTLQALLGETEHKPFECVGTVHEMRACMRALCQKRPQAALCHLWTEAHAGGVKLPAIEKEPTLADLLHAQHAHAMPQEIYQRMHALHPKLFP